MAKRRPKTVPLMTPDEVRDWTSRSEALRRQDSGWSSHAFGSLWLRTQHLLDAAAAASAGLSGLTDVVDTLLEQAQDQLFDDAGRRDLSALGAIALAETDPTLRPRVVARLRAQQHHEIHRALVEFLDAGVPAERAVLEGLASTSAGLAAMRAKTKLEKAGAAAWWLDAYASDPLAGLSPEQAAEAEPDVQAYLALARRARESGSEVTDDERFAALRRLPPVSAFAALRPLLATRELTEAQLAEAIVLGTTSEEAAALLVDAVGLLDRTVQHWASKALEAAVPRLPRAVRMAFLHGCLDRCRAAPLADLEQFGPAAHLYLSLVGNCWPADEDAQACLDFLLALGETPLERLGASTYLRRVTDQCLGEVARGRELVRAWLADPTERRLRFVIPWGPGGTSRWPVEEQVSLARTALGRPLAGGTAEWVVRTLQAGAPDELEARWDDPLLRPGIFRFALKGALLGRARRELREGRLTATEASEVLARVVFLWGGDVWRLALRYRGEPPESDPVRLPAQRFDERQREKQRAAAETLGAALSGPPTAEEWAEYRRLRAGVADAALVAEAHFDQLFPPGPWDPSDLADFLRAARWVIDSKRDDSTGALAHIARFKPAPELLPIARELLSLASQKEDDEWERNALASLRHRYEATGPAPAAATAPTTDADDDW